jgi:hypothetical protein
MRQYLQPSLWIIGLTLQYLVIRALIAGPYREFLAVFIYCICLAVTTVAEILLTIDVGVASKAWKEFYWTADVVRTTAQYCSVVSLVLLAMPKGPKRGLLVRQLLLLAGIFWAGSIWIHRDPDLTVWMTKVVRNLSFCSSVVNLALWFLLIASERRDNRLLLIAGGLGIQMTGDAIGQSLRQISIKTVGFAGALFAVFAHFACLYIWWYAFTRKDEPQDIEQPVDEHGPVIEDETEPADQLRAERVRV